MKEFLLQDAFHTFNLRVFYLTVSSIAVPENKDKKIKIKNIQNRTNEKENLEHYPPSSIAGKTSFEIVDIL